jgi:hypothetical protein
MDSEELQVQYKTETVFKPKTSEKEPVPTFTAFPCDYALDKRGWAHDSERTKGANFPPLILSPHRIYRLRKTNFWQAWL